MRRMCAAICAVALGLTLFAGCVAGYMRPPGESNANSRLQRDIIAIIGIREGAFHACDFKGFEVVQINMTSPFDGRQWQERWSVRSCDGTIHAYTVECVASPRGGTDFSVKEATDPAPASPRKPEPPREEGAEGGEGASVP